MLKTNNGVLSLQDDFFLFKEDDLIYSYLKESLYSTMDFDMYVANTLDGKQIFVFMFHETIDKNFHYINYISDLNLLRLKHGEITLRDVIFTEGKTILVEEIVEVKSKIRRVFKMVPQESLNDDAYPRLGATLFPKESS